MLNSHVASSSHWQNPNEIIDAMIDLRIQLFHLKQQIDELQADFTSACLALNIEKLALERAIITRKFTPGQWLYSDEIVEQEAFLKQLRLAFQKDHEPNGGRETTWIIKLLLQTPG